MITYNLFYYYSKKNYCHEKVQLHCISAMEFFLLVKNIQFFSKILDFENPTTKSCIEGTAGFMGFEVSFSSMPFFFYVMWGPQISSYSLINSLEKVCNHTKKPDLLSFRY